MVRKRMLDRSMLNILPVRGSPMPVMSLMTSIAPMHAAVPDTAPKTGN